MRINGVDPKVVEQVREQVSQPVVRQLKEAREINEEYREQEHSNREGSSGGLEQALEQLNQLSKTMGSSLIFRLVEKDSQAKVEVVDGQENRVIKEVNPEDVIQIVTQVEKLLGLLIDTRI